MNFKKLTSLILSSLIALGTFAVVPQVSAKDMPAETVSEKIELEGNDSEVAKELKKEIEKNEDLKKEADHLKKELSKCKEKNEYLKSKSPSFVSSVFGFFGKLIHKTLGGITVGAVFAGATFLGITGTETGNRFAARVVANSVYYDAANPANADRLRDSVNGFYAFVTTGTGIITGLLTAVLL